MRAGKTRAGSVETGKYGEKIVRMPYLLHVFSGKARLADQLVVAVASIAYGLWWSGLSLK